MQNRIDFKDEISLLRYIREKQLYVIGSASEGKCYASKIDNKAYKLLYSKSYEPRVVNYDPKDIITTSDIDLESFIFPETLIFINDKLKGYITRKVDIDLFDSDNTIDINNLYLIDFKKLLKAYYIMQKDIIKLSKANIVIYDLPFNLMFDGNRLYAIDTCSYFKEYSKNFEEIVKENISSLNYAISSIFYLWYMFEEKQPRKIKNESIEEYLKYIQKFNKDYKVKVLER